MRTTPLPETLPPAPALQGLRQVHLLTGLSDAVLADVARSARFRRYRRGQTVVHPEDGARDLCLVSAGRVRIIMLSPGGREVRFRDIDAGGVFGEMSALDGRPRCVTVLALEDTLLACIGPAALETLLQHHWPVCERLLRGLAAALRDLTERVYALSALSVQQRLIAELLRQAQPDDGDPGRARLAPAPRPTDLAATIGTSREQVSRELASLARDALVRRDSSALWLDDVCRLAERLEGWPLAA